MGDSEEQRVKQRENVLEKKKAAIVGGTVRFDELSERNEFLIQFILGEAMVMEEELMERWWRLKKGGKGKEKMPSLAGILHHAVDLQKRISSNTQRNYKPPEIWTDFIDGCRVFLLRLQAISLGYGEAQPTRFTGENIKGLCKCYWKTKEGLLESRLGQTPGSETPDQTPPPDEHEE